MNFAGNFLLKVAQSPGCVRGLIRLHLSYCTMRTMFWLKELRFYFNQFCGGVQLTEMSQQGFPLIYPKVTYIFSFQFSLPRAHNKCITHRRNPHTELQAIFCNFKLSFWIWFESVHICVRVSIFCLPKAEWDFSHFQSTAETL